MLWRIICWLFFGWHLEIWLMQQVIADNDALKQEAPWVDTWYITEWEVTTTHSCTHILCVLTVLPDVRRLAV